MTMTSFRRFWLAWRWDVAAAVGTFIFGVSSFWAAGWVGRLLVEVLR
jgi:hypothetical protein